MKKKMKTPKVVFSNGLRLTLDPNLKPLPVTGELARKIEEANEKWSKIKNLDEICKRLANDSSHE
jgi:hypothetical protein